MAVWRTHELTLGIISFNEIIISVISIRKTHWANSLYWRDVPCSSRIRLKKKGGGSTFCFRNIFFFWSLRKRKLSIYSLYLHDDKREKRTLVILCHTWHSSSRYWKHLKVMRFSKWGISTSLIAFRKEIWNVQQGFNQCKRPLSVLEI